MAAAPNASFKELLNLCQKEGLKVERLSTMEAVIRDEERGFVWHFDLTESSQNRVRLVEGVLEQPQDFEDRTGRLQSKMVIFGDILTSPRRGGKNVLGDLATGVGLDLRNHQKKKHRAKAPEAPAQETPSTPEEAPMADVIQEILSNLSAVEDLLHSAVLQEARKTDCPVQWENDKKFLDYEGHVLLFEFLSLLPLTEGLDSQNPEHLAPLDTTMEPYLYRQGRLRRIHILDNRTAVWRVRDDGRVFKDAMPDVPPPAPAPVVVPVAEEAPPVRLIDAKIDAVTSIPEAEPVVAEGKNLYPCPKCSFTDFSKQALVMHTTKLGEGDHPQTALACPICVVVVKNTSISLQTHMRTRHGAGSLCYPCIDGHNREGTQAVLWFGSAEAYNSHLDTVHEGERRRHLKAEAPAPVAEPEPAEHADEEAAQADQEALSEQESPTEPTAEPERPGAAMTRSEAVLGRVVVTSTPDEAMQATLLQMLNSVPQLQQENVKLLEELRLEREETEKAHARWTAEIERRKTAEAQLAAVREAQAALQRALNP